MCRFKFAFQAVYVLPTVCVRRAALAAPFRHCAGSNSPFKPLVRFRTSSDGERLSPHPFNILSLLFYFVLAKRQCAAPNLPAMCRFKFAFQTVCVLLQFVYGWRLSPHPSGNVPVQIRLSNRLCISALRLTASGFSRTLLTFYLSFLLI